jgi:hypothetical protein
VGELQHFHGIERFFEDHHPVRVAQPRHHRFPRIIRIGGADHDLQRRIGFPNALGRLDAIPPRRHAYIDERQRVRAFLGQGRLHPEQGILPLISRIELEAGRPRFGHRACLVTKQRCLSGRKLLHPRGRLQPEDFFKILVDGCVVVDNQDTTIPRCARFGGLISVSAHYGRLSYDTLMASQSKPCR